MLTFLFWSFAVFGKVPSDLKVSSGASAIEHITLMDEVNGVCWTLESLLERVHRDPSTNTSAGRQTGDNFSGNPHILIL